MAIQLTGDVDNIEELLTPLSIPKRTFLNSITDPLLHRVGITYNKEKWILIKKDENGLSAPGVSWTNSYFQQCNIPSS